MSGARHQLRPIERVVLRMVDEGLETSEIARRLKRRPRSVRLIERLARMRLEQDLGAGSARSRSGLRPIEMCVLRRLNAGETYGDVGSRLLRSGTHIQRIEAYAKFKQSGGLEPSYRAQAAASRGLTMEGN